MPRPPAARDKLLAAFEQLVLAEGERAATLDAVAGAAGVSKGGLLYHFPHRRALVDATLQRLEELLQLDLEAMAAAPEGAARYFLVTSLFEDSQLDRALVVASRLAQSGDENARASLQRLGEAWYALVLADVGDPVVATAVQQMGDGLYHNASIGLLPDGSAQRHTILENLLAVVDRLSPRS
ncbi:MULTISPECIES: TetR/AcrR family transcriptional regulator [Kocuria]|uniref:TetR/AcrR family transcriptional regulator n=1 Tax=Kocuria oceani TaxID=988827 RepID=A0ABV9THU0_9MICC|nr:MULTISPECIES: TetR/AcrR family transcriptional regulator [Kocuria]KLU11447.1 TetR family transcriptional regulator [Kocuria sp. SM24M-10]OLT08080.1 TetR family transcriptional regulator [Kocuria sp. CNJ-770]